MGTQIFWDFDEMSPDTRCHRMGGREKRKESWNFFGCGGGSRSLMNPCIYREYLCTYCTIFV